MKQNSLPCFYRCIGVILISLAISAGAFAYPSGSPAGYTGSPGDTHHCVSCHGGSSATVTGWITSDIPSAGYTPGAVYTITATVSGSGKKGFEVSPQNIAGTQLGTLAAGTNNHLVGGTKYVTQNSSGSSSSTVIYTFTWTAPVAGTGPVTFYGAFCVGKSSTKLSTLDVTENPALPLSAAASATPALICAGQSSQLDVVPVGGSGTYTYSWTSIPAGFTSSLPNPVVTPAVTTQYVAHVFDGAVTVDSPTDLTVTDPAAAMAGNDTTLSFSSTQVPLNGTASNYASVLWSSSGTGTFSAASSLSGNYLPSLADKTAGTVTLTLTASALSPCTLAASDDRIIHFDAPTGGEDQPDIMVSMTISPNPSSGHFAIRVSGIDKEHATVSISDIRGKTVIQSDVDLSGMKPAQFDLSASPRGLYFVKIQTETMAVVRKLVVE